MFLVTIDPKLTLTVHGSFRLNRRTVNWTEIANTISKMFRQAQVFHGSIVRISPNVRNVYGDGTNEKKASATSSEHEKKRINEQRREKKFKDRVTQTQRTTNIFGP